MNIFSLTGLIIVVSNSLLSLFLFVKGKRRMHNIWVVFCLTVAIWGIGVYKIGMETDYAKAIFWWRLGYFGVIFIPVLYTHFIFEFLNIKKKRLLIFLYSVTIFFQILNLTDYFIKDLELVFSGFYYISNPTIFYNLFVIIFFSTVLYAIYKMIQIMKESDGYYKKQLRSFLWATYTGYIGGLFAFMPVYDIFIYPYLNILVGLFPIIIAYASLRHRMFDVAMVFQRGVIFSVLFGIISAFYIIVLVSVESVLPFEKVSSFVSGLITIIAGIYGVPVIEKYFRKLTDRIFFKDKYNYSDTLFSLSQTLNRNIDIKYMFNEIMQKLKIIFKIDKVKFIYIDNRDIKINHQTYFDTISLSEELLGSIKDEYIPIMNKTEALERLEELKMEDKKRYKKNKKIFENFFQDKSAYLYVPIYLENKLIAFILLGAKKSGDSYNSEDYKLLRTFSFQAGVAIEKARLFREVRDYSEDLEQKVEERTARIKNLQEEQRLMMHEIAHGLQTPLTILKTELSDLSENKEAKEKVVSIEKSIDRVSKLIYEMLRLAKLEANNNEVKDFSKFNFSELMTELVENYEIITAGENIKIKSKIEDNIFLFGNSSEIEELITNLVSNSVKYKKPNQDNIISLILSKNKNKVEVLVSDTGLGISEDDQKHLFERFFRGEKDKSVNVQGTGLGLVIVKKIVEAHNGSIEVHSKKGKGTEFKITF